ncbi:MAG: DUF1698 domain-containing protein [Flavobacteriaceae bacterium]|nr:DUF1698 domain-containing protein [Flavobacteriaceae bacterium]
MTHETLDQSRPQPPARDDILARAAAYRWFHRIRLYGDYETPGIDNTPEKLQVLDLLGLPKNMTGKRVLDIGAWDGFFSFECERRGAEVVALDHVQSTDTGFHIAAQALDSKVTWTVANIYHLSPEELGRFDIVLCLGVIYHLRHVLLGLDRVRSIMAEGADLFVETAAIDNHAQLDGGHFGSFAQACLGANSTPLLQLYPEKELGGDPTNFFAPNHSGLRGLLKAAEFDVVNSLSGPGPLPSRALAHARATVNPEIAFYRDRDSAVLERRNYFTEQVE